MSKSQSATIIDTYKRLLQAIKPYIGIFTIGIISTLVASGFTASITWLVKPMVDEGLVKRDPIFLKWLPLALIIVFLLRSLATFASKYFISRAGRNVIMDFRQQVFAHLLRLPTSFYDQHTSGKLLALIVYNIAQLADAVTDSLLILIQEGALALGLIVVMFVISWPLTIAFLLIAPFIAIIFKIVTRRLHFLSLSAQDTMAEITQAANEAIDGFKVVRIFGGEQYEQQKFDKATRSNRNKELKIVVAEALGTASIQFIVVAPIVIIIYLITSRIIDISAGGFGAMIMAVMQLLRPLRRLTRINTNIQKGVAGARSVYQILDKEPEVDAGNIVLAKACGKIEFRNVEFSYPNTNAIVLDSLNFIVKPGQTIAIVGRSGSGKSTTVNLLPRFYDVKKGAILVDNKNIQDYKLTDLRKQFAFVSQHISLFNDTVARNIAYGRYDEFDEKDIIKAAEAANFMEVVEQLPEGLNTVIGEQGLRLSGGQRQRLAIARAILKNAPILILDEATSALDTEVEVAIQNALVELMANRTTLVIAHRLSTVENADQILVLKDGAIVEEGNHKQLLLLNGFYAKLYKMQFSE